MTIGQESVMNSNESWRFDILSELEQPSPRWDLEKKPAKSIPPENKTKTVWLFRDGDEKEEVYKEQGIGDGGGGQVIHWLSIFFLLQKILKNPGRRRQS